MTLCHTVSYLDLIICIDALIISCNSLLKNFKSDRTISKIKQHNVQQIIDGLRHCRATSLTFNNSSNNKNIAIKLTFGDQFASNQHHKVLNSLTEGVNTTASHTMRQLNVNSNITACLRRLPQLTLFSLCCFAQYTKALVPQPVTLLTFDVDGTLLQGSSRRTETSYHAQAFTHAISTVFSDRNTSVEFRSQDTSTYKSPLDFIPPQNYHGINAYSSTYCIYFMDKHIFKL